MASESLSAVQAPAHQDYQYPDLLKQFVRGASGLIGPHNVIPSIKFAWRPTWVYYEYFEGEDHRYSTWKKVWLKRYTKYTGPYGELNREGVHRG